jgi:hypothetical protein
VLPLEVGAKEKERLKDKLQSAHGLIRLFDDVQEGSMDEQDVNAAFSYAVPEVSLHDGIYRSFNATIVLLGIHFQVSFTHSYCVLPRSCVVSLKLWL